MNEQRVDLAVVVHWPVKRRFGPSALRLPIRQQFGQGNCPDATTSPQRQYFPILVLAFDSRESS